MAYSTETELRNNLSVATADRIASIVVTTRIAQADLRIKADLSKIIDFDEIGTTPTFINLLSQYKTAELCLVYAYGTKRKADEQTDIDYWKKEYNNLIDMINNDEVELVDGDGTSISTGHQTFTNTAKNNIEPALGIDKYGDFIDKDDLEDERPIE